MADLANLSLYLIDCVVVTFAAGRAVNLLTDERSPVSNVIRASTGTDNFSHPKSAVVWRRHTRWSFRDSQFRQWQYQGTLIREVRSKETDSWKKTKIYPPTRNGVY
ncbi:MAG TPA: hypothetical protein VKJ45_01080, partial [Blastocatellia bacterium]|nr:hypothetical protein [Blastocatellia bacterium]